MNCIQTYTGGKFDFDDLESNEINIEDIAHSLSMLCRYNGHTKMFYSVAEHSLLIAEVVSDKAKLFALLHDAAEVYISDISRPLKKFLSYQGTSIKDFESQVLKVILKRFDIDLYQIPTTIRNEVNEADNRILVNERGILNRCNDESIWESWIKDIKPLTNIVIRCEPPFLVEPEFLKKYRYYSMYERFFPR